jgi:hypothetical protein
MENAREADRQRDDHRFARLYGRLVWNPVLVRSSFPPISNAAFWPIARTLTLSLFPCVHDRIEAGPFIYSLRQRARS